MIILSLNLLNSMQNYIKKRVPLYDLFKVKKLSIIVIMVVVVMLMMIVKFVVDQAIALADAVVALLLF